MRKSVMVLLPFLAACMGGTSTQVLSEGGIAPTDPPSDYTPATPPGEVFLGHVSFGLLLNDERALEGVRLLEENAYLNAAASGHALDMVAHNYLSHTGRDGSTPGDRAQAAGYEWSYISENIARGFTTEAGVIDGWMNSPGHRSNMLDQRAEDFGLGRVNTTWVLMLGAQM